jgi:hypothetical protein
MVCNVQLYSTWMYEKRLGLRLQLKKVENKWTKTKILLQLFIELHKQTFTLNP